MKHKKSLTFWKKPKEFIDYDHGCLNKEFNYNKLKDDRGVILVDKIDVQEELKYLRDYNNYVKESSSISF